MDNKNFKTYDEYLDYRLDAENQKKEKIVAAQTNKKKRKINKLVIRITALAASVITLTASIVALAGFSKRNKNKIDAVPNNSIVSEISDDNSNSLETLGIELQTPNTNNTKKEYGNTTGKVDTNKIVKDSNGKIWANEQAKENSKDVGKKVTDDNNGKYIVTNDGKVVDKETSYEVKDETGKVIDSGTLNDSGIPNGYSWDEGRGEYVPTGDVGKYVYNDKGELVSKTNQNKPTTTPQTSSETKPEQPTKPTTNTNGTYTIYGLTFESKADYEQWVIQGYTGYGEVNGIMVPETKEMQDALKQAQKVK